MRGVPSPKVFLKFVHPPVWNIRAEFGLLTPNAVVVKRETVPPSTEWGENKLTWGETGSDNYERQTVACVPLTVLASSSNLMVTDRVPFTGSISLTMVLRSKFTSLTVRTAVLLIGEKLLSLSKEFATALGVSESLMTPN